MDSQRENNLFVKTLVKLYYLTDNKGSGMPYHIVHVPGGYKVERIGTLHKPKHFLSGHPLTRDMAIKQLQAVLIHSKY